MKNDLNLDEVLIKLLRGDCEISESFKAWCEDKEISVEEADDLDEYIFAEDYSQNLWR